MYLPYLIALSILVVSTNTAENNSRFHPKSPRKADLPPAEHEDSDAMVNHLLQWIQKFYQQQNTRKARQYFGARAEKPRPFGVSYLPPTGYPPAGSRPTPAYNEGPSNPPYDNPPYQPSQPLYQPSLPQQPQPDFQPSYQPSQPTIPPYQSSQPSEAPYTPSQPSETPSDSSLPTNRPSQPPYESSQPSQPPYEYNSPSQPSYESSQPSQAPYESSQASQTPYESGQSAQPSPTPSTQPSYETSQNDYESTLAELAQGAQAASTLADDDDDRHPPHIHAITVDCGKEMMTINIEFNKPYNGIIYSQDHYKESECVYVRENSNQIKYSFTVSLDKCGTRFFSDFENEGQAYLENVLVLQNEAGIQEVWDHIRRVRCLWEGSLTKQLVSSLSVGMLNQITSNFSGDTAMARLDIQTGRGPFAPEANGLIKIGETMTLVVSVTGDAGFDILVRECVARDADNVNVVKLTDSNGCILKPKLFGTFQKTKDTGNTGASIIAFAFFKAFKFPDEMDLIIQCEVELCKTDCEVCPNPGSIEPRRRRRDVIHYGNKTIEPVTTIGKGMRVVFAEDLPAESEGCVTPNAMLWGGFLVMAGSLISSLLVSFLWQRSRGSVKFLSS